MSKFTEHQALALLRRLEPTPFGDEAQDIADLIRRLVADRDACFDALTEVEAVLRNDLYAHRVHNALTIIDDEKHRAEEHDL